MINCTHEWKEYNSIFQYINIVYCFKNPLWHFARSLFWSREVAHRRLWTTNCEAPARIRSWHNRRNIAEFARNDWEKSLRHQDNLLQGCDSNRVPSEYIPRILETHQAAHSTRPFLTLAINKQGQVTFAYQPIYSRTVFLKRCAAMLWIEESLYGITDAN